MDDGRDFECWIRCDARDRKDPEIGDRPREGLHDLGVAEKIYGVVALLVILTTFLVIMSIQSVRLQTAYRHLLSSSATNAINIERVNGLIYAIVMESRGIYMSTDRPKVKQFSDELLRRNRELADVVAGWEATVRPDDAAQFSAFRQRKNSRKAPIKRAFSRLRPSINRVSRRQPVGSPPRAVLDRADRTA